MRPSDERCSPRVFIEVPFQLHICDCGTIGDQCNFLSVAGFIDALARELHWVNILGIRDCGCRILEDCGGIRDCGSVRLADMA